MKSIKFSVPNDGHVHFRNGARCWSVVEHTARQFGRAVVMPNLSPKHVTTVDEVIHYRDEILRAVPKGIDFSPLMTVSLTPEITLTDLHEALKCEYVYGVKLYAGNTTNSAGINNLKNFSHHFAMIQNSGKPLLVHGEAGTDIDVFDRERVFYEEWMLWLLHEFPAIRVVCEHITTAYVAIFVESRGDNVAATITPHHLLSTRNDMLGKGGIRPDLYCMPILKTENDRAKLLSVATSGNSKFFLGTDSAPHPMFGLPKMSKYSACGCAGCYVAPHALELYAEAFDSVGKLDRLPNFASGYMEKFYGLQPNKGTVTVSEVEEWKLPESYEFGDQEVAPYRQWVPLRFKAMRNTA